MLSSKEALEKLLEMAIENGLWKSGLVEDIENIILRDLEVLEIIKKNSFLFVEKGKLYCGRYADVELLIEEDDFDDKEEYKLLKEWLEEWQIIHLQ